MAFTKADLVLGRLVPERLLMALRLVFFLANAAALAFAYGSAAGPGTGAGQPSALRQGGCFSFVFATWALLAAVVYFALALSFHCKYRTLVARHFEYHESLLELSQDPGLGSTQFDARERVARIAWGLAAVACTVNLLALSSGPVSFAPSPPPEIYAAAAVTIALEAVLNRHTLRIAVVFECLVLGILFCGATWAINGSGSCRAFFSVHNNATLPWYTLHEFEGMWEGDDPGSAHTSPWMPYVALFGALLLSAAVMWCAAASRYHCLASEKDLTNFGGRKGVGDFVLCSLS